MVGEAISREKSAEILDIFAGGDNRGFDVIGAEGLAETDGGEEDSKNNFFVFLKHKMLLSLLNY